MTYLVSILKRFFSALAVSIVGLACAAYEVYASAQPLDFLARTNISSFPDWKPIVSHPEFPDGHYFILKRPIPHPRARKTSHR